MDGITKSVAETIPMAPAVHKAPVTLNTTSWEGIPVDVFRYFGMDIGRTSKKEMDRVRSVFKWASSGLEDPTIGNAMRRMRDLENHLGATRKGETRQDKMFNWVAIQEHINDLKSRQEALGDRRDW